jgi:hypothetical protein
LKRRQDSRGVDGARHTETEEIKEIKAARRGPKPADEAGGEEGVEEEAA